MTVAGVELWRTRIGAVALTGSRGVASFQYDPAFLASGIQLAPLMMPLADRVYTFPELSPRTFRGLPGLLVAGLALLHAMQRLCLGPPTPDASPGPAGLATLLPLWMNLVLALVLALVLPAPLAALLREGARLAG